MHRQAVSAPLPGLFITSLPRRQRCGSGAAANSGAAAAAAAVAASRGVSAGRLSETNGRDVHVKDGDSSQPARKSFFWFTVKKKPNVLFQRGPGVSFVKSHSFKIK